jgi:putative ABC transport system permease protein
MQSPAGTFGVALRTDVEPGSLGDAVRREVLAFDRSASVTQIQTLDAFIEQFWVGQNVFTAILGGFGVLALLLAALGTYGVLAYSVARRTHEIGIRMAIGASRGKVLGMIVRQGLLLALVGMALGVPLILAQVRVISTIFAGLVSVEPGSALGVVAVLAVVTLAASAIPARRAASVDPIEALRCE